jgi:hypothetical protein
MPNDSNDLLSSPPVVAIAGWLLPGSGYVLLGEQARGITVGVTIILLFLAGLLIAGVRVVEVPGYDVATGQPELLQGQWIMSVAPLAEIRNKLWSVPQALTGPIAIVAAAASVHAAQPNPDQPDPAKAHHQLGALTHSRINEIGALYLSVAGLLNLMAIIDSAWRASNLAEARAGEQAAA